MPIPNLEYRLDQIRKKYAKRGMWISGTLGIATAGMFIYLDRWMVHSGQRLFWWTPVVQSLAVVWNALWFVRSYREYRYLTKKYEVTPQEKA